MGQVKHSISITRSNKQFGEVIQAAWIDFTNPKVFTKEKDVIVLLTGPLSSVDENCVKWLLDQAKSTNNANEFYRRVQQTNFSPPKSEEKLSVLEYHLSMANEGEEISREMIYDFLQHFFILNYDLGKEYGVILSLLNSHISITCQLDPHLIWSRIADFIQTWNQNAGTITRDKLPKEILEAFSEKRISRIPDEFNAIDTGTQIDWTHHPNASYLALVNLIGSWDEKNNNDIEVFTKLVGIDYDSWLVKARELLQLSGGSLSVKNGIWEITNRIELWNNLGPRILDHNLDTFQTLALSILQEPDPAFDLPSEQRFAASLYNKTPQFSKTIRKGIAEGLAIIGNHPEACKKLFT